MRKPLNEQDIKQQMIRLSHLLPYKDKSEAFLRSKAIDLVKKKEVDIDVDTLFGNKNERKLGKKLLFRYLEDFSIETISDKNTLRELIFYEIIQQRLQDKVNRHFKDDDKAVPISLIEMLHKNSDIIIKLKNTLGLNEDKAKSPYDAFNHLISRWKSWRQENQGSRTIICSYCGKMILLKIRAEAWEAQKHPFFKDRILYNQYLFKLYKANTISKEDVARVLECSTDYIDWILDKVEKKEEVERQQNKCPKCNKGYLSNTWNKEKNVWVEVCTDCDFSHPHECRRIKETKIVFPERRKE